MKRLRGLQPCQRAMGHLRRGGKRIGFVPTMGALHEGHLSLIRRARAENDIVVVSLFVNPLQFGPREDFKRYPRAFAEDCRKLSREKVDYLFLPSLPSFYPRGFQTFVEVTELTRGLCGRFRPGHFRGVTTVVTKLFNLIKPHRAYFGAKDYQQALVVKQMAEDLNFDLEVKVLPSVRDQDGLALSSRNTYLTREARQRALALPRTLAWAKREARLGRRNLTRLRGGVFGRLRAGLDRIDYVAFVDPKHLQPVKTLQGKVLLAVAGWVGKTRLIDNVIIRP